MIYTTQSCTSLDAIRFCKAALIPFRAGRPRPSLVSLLGEMTDAGAIGRRMLEAAEKVVEDAKAFEAMFDPTAPVKPVAGPQTQTLGTQVSHRVV